jgi:hypothetical protein
MPPRTLCNRALSKSSAKYNVHDETAAGKAPMEADPELKWVLMKETAERLCSMWMETEGLLQEFTGMMQEFGGIMKSDQTEDVCVFGKFKWL